MHHDPFSKCHPAVSFLYFICAIGFAVVIQHPAYLLLGFVGSAVYYLLLQGRKALKAIGFLVPMFLVLTLVNPLFNTRGEHVLLTLFGRPYTLEALCYGAAIGSIFVIMMLWFGCYNAVMTGDKFTSLFGNLIPSLSLLLVMVLRMVPGFMRKAAQISGARNAIGKGTSSTDSLRRRLSGGMQVLSALTSWALEGSIATADSMRSRGYGTARRTSFQIYRMTLRDWVLLSLTLFLGMSVIAAAAAGGVTATYTPTYYAAPVTGVYSLGLASYGAYLLIPTILHLKEALLWHISRSRI